MNATECKTTCSNLDSRFDASEEILDYFDTEDPIHINRPSPRRISMDIPEAMVAGLDRAAERLGVNRQAVIKFAIDRFLDEERAKHGGEAVL